jgi:soluble lytic murein transglycosylase
VRRALLILACAAAAIAASVVYLQRAEPAWWVRLWYPLSYRTLVTGYARTYRLDPALVAAVVYQESRFRPDTRSPAGAIGLMQLLPRTAQGIAERTGGSRFRTSDLLDPDINLRYGCWYLRHLSEKYAGYPRAGDLALAAYNAGQANVDRWIAETPPGRPVRLRFASTRSYVRSVRRLQGLYRKAYPTELGYDSRAAG